MESSFGMGSLRRGDQGQEQCGFSGKALRTGPIRLVCREVRYSGVSSVPNLTFGVHDTGIHPSLHDCLPLLVGKAQRHRAAVYHRSTSLIRIATGAFRELGCGRLFRRRGQSIPDLTVVCVVLDTSRLRKGTGRKKCTSKGRRVRKQNSAMARPPQ